MRASRACLFPMLLLLLLFSEAAAESPVVLWSEDRIVAFGQGVASGTGPGAKLLARRAAVVDLQRNLLEHVEGVRIEARTKMKDFMVHDSVRSVVQGLVRHVEIWQATWDGEIYTVEGGIRLRGLRQALAPKLDGLAPRAVSAYSGEGYDSLVLDVSHLPFVPSMVFTVRRASGAPLYGPRFIDERTFIEKGLCRYVLERSPRAPQALLASPAWADDDRALVLAEGISLSPEGDIVIPDEAADLIEANAFDFRIPGEVTIITKTAALRGRGLVPLLAHRP